MCMPAGANVQMWTDEAFSAAECTQISFVSRLELFCWKARYDAPSCSTHLACLPESEVVLLYMC